MVFYKVEAERVCGDEEIEMTRQEQRSLSAELAEKSESLYAKTMGECMIVTVCIKPQLVTLAAISQSHELFHKQIKRYEKILPFKIDDVSIEEVTFASFDSLLIAAERNNYIKSCEEILERFGIDELNSHHGCCDFGEAIIFDDYNFEQLKDFAREFLFDSTLVPEIERIEKSITPKKIYGHPVHYMFRTVDKETRTIIYKALISALYRAGRIRNKRYSFVDLDLDRRFSLSNLEAIYRANVEGVVVVRYIEDDVERGNYASNGSKTIKEICNVAQKYKNKTLTIICLPSNETKIKEQFFSNFGNTSFIELYDDVVTADTALNYLKCRAKEYAVRVDKKLKSQLIDGNGYTAPELDSIFEGWYQKKLRNEIYPEYKIANTVKAKIQKEKPRGRAYDRLQELIGLKNAKEVMRQALNYFKVQKMFADKGFNSERPSMHMVFTGNPGTAKTTVARLFAEIMKDNGLLATGEIYEVGRADLVGKFVGHTAPLVKAAFKKAKGGVLFIDEAYSLVDDRDGMFGDEAINTIVQEMENHREDTVVIFAGYPDKMEQFLKKNPGLRSRIAFHIPFDDYNVEELCDIAELIAKEKGFQIDINAKKKLADVFEYATKSSDFGNGRYARNVVEKAKMAQANRLVSMDFDKITDKEVFTLTADDIEMPLENKKEKIIKIGFCA